VKDIPKEFKEQLREVFKLTKESLKKLNGEIPGTESLKNIENQEFFDKSSFLKAVEQQIGKEQTNNRYKMLILEHAQLKDYNYKTVTFHKKKVEKDYKALQELGEIFKKGKYGLTDKFNLYFKLYRLHIFVCFVCLFVIIIAINWQILPFLSSPPLTPTSTVKPTVAPSLTLPSHSKVTQLLAQAEECLEKKWLMTPEHDNAFHCYQEVLTLAPENRQAREGVYAIARQYKEWGDNYYSTNFQQAFTYYKRYLQVTEYIFDMFGDETLRFEYDDVNQRIMATPTWTSPPIPTVVVAALPTEVGTPIPTRSSPSIPTAMANTTPTSIPVSSSNPDTFNCTSPQPQGIDEVLNQILPQDLDQYNSLKIREQQGEQLNSQIITAIERIICDFKAIEQILEENDEQHPDDEVKKRIQTTKETRQRYEQERKNRL
jgi:hypothetical protein